MLFSLRDTGFHAKKRGNAPLLIGRIKIIILFGRKHSSTTSLKGITNSLNMILFFCTILCPLFIVEIRR